MTSTDLRAFSRDLIQDVIVTAEATDTTLPDAFTQRMIEHLVEAGEIDDGLVCYHRARGIEVSGYAVSDDETRIDVFVTHFRHDAASPTLPLSELATLTTRLRSFVNRCRTGYLADVDDASPVYDMVQDLERALKVATGVRLLVLTNATTRAHKVRPETLDGIEFVHQVWDVARLHRLLTSGTLHEPIVVDFADRFGAPLPCLSTPVTDQDYSVLFTIMPGNVLASLYDEYGTRLLELNVRSFLQAKGAVNRGIRETLLKTPERFLAYNNGISATASKVELVTAADGSAGIAKLHDLQIVNGGQTTASVHSAVRKDNADVSRVLVQAKVTVVSPERLEEIVPAISRYSNTQNKVTTADFSSNDTLHVEVEKLSRSVWAPGDGQDTHWFYERARGQYADELARQRTPAKMKAWKLSNPTRQKFTKTDLAKYLATWDQLPHVVSRGAEKNFREFMIRMSTNGRPLVDETFFKRAVAKALLFKETERIVSSKNFGGYRANIITFTIAKLVNATSGRIDLDSAWRAQALTPALEAAIADLCVLVQNSITNPPRAANIGEWCKRPESWTRVEALAWPVPAALASELLDLLARRRRDARSLDPSSQGAQIAAAAAIPGQTWFETAHWARETVNLQPWQRGLAYSLGQRQERGVEPTAKQAVQGLVLLKEALRLGFRPQIPVSNLPE